ncbi:hypothetical protein CC78DRAFT_566813, partial [Lojkania enalia]
MHHLQLLVLIGVASRIRTQDIRGDPDYLMNQDNTTTITTVVYQLADALANENSATSVENSMVNTTASHQLKTSLANASMTPSAEASKAAQSLLPIEPYCEPKRTGKGPVPTPDTAANFRKFDEFEKQAYGVPTPSGYHMVFSNRYASTSNIDYLGYITMDSYDPNNCTAHCDGMENCVAINIFFERNPTLIPGPECPNPSSTTIIKCTFWRGKKIALHINNFGYRDFDFEVAIAGSN